MDDKLIEILTRHIHNERICFARCYHRRFRVLLVIAFVVLLGIPAFFFYMIGAVGVHDSSMSPFYQNGDILVYTRIHKSYQYGEVVIYEYAGEKRVGRVIGINGDRIEFSSGGSRLAVNGQTLTEPYAAGADRYGSTAGFPLTVPEETLFLLEDNRDLALESGNENPGLVELKRVKGKVLFMIRTNSQSSY